MFTLNQSKNRPLSSKIVNDYEIEELLKQPYNADDINPIETQDKSNSWDDSQYYETLLPMLQEYEAFKPKTYIPTPNDKPTIGYGHTGKYAKPGATMDKATALDVLRDDAESRTKVIQGKIPGFKELPLDIAVQLGQSAFRGGITGSPNTIKLINSGDFKGAAKEFLNNREYKTAVESGRAGIRKRMEAVSEALSKPGTGVSPAANLKSGTL